MAAAPPARGCEAAAERASLERGGSGPPLTPRSAADESASQWHYRTRRGLFGTRTLAQLRAWRPGLEQRGMFASLRVWRAGEDEATHTVLLSDVLESVQEREAAPGVAPSDDGDEEKALPLFKGVYRKKAYKAWKAEITIAGKIIGLGMFNTQLDAAKQHDRCVLGSFCLACAVLRGFYIA
jgi:hypothetical protein